MKRRIALLSLAAILAGCGGGTEADLHNGGTTNNGSNTPAQSSADATAAFAAQYQVFDDFQRADTTDGNIGSPVKGSPWVLRGNYAAGTLPPATIGRIHSNTFVVDPPATAVNQADYAQQALTNTATRVGAVIQFNANTGVNQGTHGFTWAMLVGPQDPAVLNMIHFTGTRNAWKLELWTLDGQHITLASGTFATSLQVGKPYVINMDVAGDTVTFTAPGLAPQTVTDSRIPARAGKYVIWEHFTDGPTNNTLLFKSVWATDVTTLPALTVPENLTTP